MIKIDKGEAPAGHIANANRLTKLLVDEFDKHSDDYLSGKKAFGKQITGFYKSDLVKNALKCRQNNKCCFSEAKFNGDYFNVEHFRPKGGFDNWFCSKSMHYPGYYWLAYAWSNLFLSKTRVNTTFKDTSFPLFDEAKRNRNHHDINVEAHVLIDPSIEDPRVHIGFHNDEPYGITQRGLFNIIFLGLRDDEDIVTDRIKRLEFLKRIKDSVDLFISLGIPQNHPVVADNIITLRTSMHPAEAFSSMATDLLSDWLLHLSDQDNIEHPSVV